MERKMTKRKPPQTGTEPVLRKIAAMAYVGLGPSQFDDLVFAGKLPPPIRIVDGGHAVAWVRSELDDWLKERIAARDAAPPKMKDTKLVQKRSAKG
jgi:predicted DNA-binding transcriptional regulator AlpA